VCFRRPADALLRRSEAGLTVRSPRARKRNRNRKGKGRKGEDDAPTPPASPALAPAEALLRTAANAGAEWPGLRPAAAPAAGGEPGAAEAAQQQQLQEAVLRQQQEAPTEAALGGNDNERTAPSAWSPANAR
jgi:hypothetical protein